MTTPRVTVPVKGQSFADEQEWINRASRALTAHPDYNNTEHGETNGWRGNHFTALCFDQAGNRMRCGADFKRATKEATYPVWWVWPDQIAAMLSAAPAPEGGAVLEDALDAWIVEGMKKADQRIAEINPVGCSGMTPEDVKTGRVSAYQKGFQNGVKSTLTDAAFVIMNAAPATREEAPAPCKSCNGSGMDAGSRFNRCPDCCEEAPAEAGERGELLQELSDAARWRRLPGNENHLATAALFERAISALRGQPPAREDALPVDGDWQSIAMWMGFAASVIKSGEPWTDQCQREFDEAKAAYARLSATHPAPDALREDSQAWGMLADLVSWFTKPVQGQNGMVWVIPAGEQGVDDAVNAALAALLAVREPDAETQLDAWLFTPDEDYSDFQRAADFTAMIDAILNEDQPK